MTTTNTTNIAKRSAKKAQARSKASNTKRAISKALNIAVETAQIKETSANTESVQLQLEAWVTVLKGRITGFYPTRTKARAAVANGSPDEYELGSVRKALVSLV